MRQRNLYGIVLLLLVGLVLPPGQLPGQNAGMPGPTAWAGVLPVAAADDAPSVIATSHGSSPSVPPEPAMSLPDDGLKPLLPHPTTPTARPKSTASAVLSPGGVQRALYVTPANLRPGKVDPGVVPAAAPFPVPAPVRPVGEGSALALEVKGPPTLAPGQTLSCTVIARNLGRTVLAGVRVEVPLPEAAHLVASEPHVEQASNKLSWWLGNIEGGGERSLKIDLATSEPGELHVCPTASFGVAIGLRTRIVRPPFALAVTGPEHASTGGRIVWKITIGNYTAVPLRHIELCCRLTAGLSFPQGDRIATEMNDLAPGQERSVELPVQAVKPGRQVISLDAKADAGLTAEARGVVKVDEVALTVAPNGPRSGRVGDTLSFHLSLSNPGSNPTGPIRLTWMLPEGLEFISANNSGTWNPATRAIGWTLEGLGPQHKHEVEFTVRARKGGDWALAAAVQSEGMAEMRTTAAVHIAAAPVLTIHATGHEDRLGMGNDTIYELRIHNQGPPPADGVRLRLLLPDNLLAVQAAAPVRWQIQGQQVLFEPIELMRTHVTAVYRIRVRGQREGMGRVRVELTADGMSRPLLHELTCRVQQVQTLTPPVARGGSR